MNVLHSGTRLHNRSMYNQLSWLNGQEVLYFNIDGIAWLFGPAVWTAGLTRGTPNLFKCCAKTGFRGD